MRGDGADEPSFLRRRRSRFAVAGNAPRRMELQLSFADLPGGTKVAAQFQLQRVFRKHGFVVRGEAQKLAADPQCVAGTHHIEAAVNEQKQILRRSGVIVGAPGAAFGGGEASGLVSVSVPRGLDFKTAAELGGLSVDELRALNPGYRHEVIHRHDSTLLVPAGTAQRLIDELDGRTFPAPQLPATAQPSPTSVRKQLAARAADKVTKSGKRGAKPAKNSARTGKKGKKTGKARASSASPSKSSTKSSAKSNKNTASTRKKKK